MRRPGQRTLRLLGVGGVVLGLACDHEQDWLRTAGMRDIATGAAPPLRVLADASALGDPAASPDGRLVAATDVATGDLVVLELSTGRLRSLTSNPEPYVPGFGYSPVFRITGDSIAFLWVDESGDLPVQVRISAVDGSGLRTLTTLDAFSASLHAWDERHGLLLRRLPHAGPAQFVSLDASTAGERVLRTLEDRRSLRPFLSHDGRYLAWDDHVPGTDQGRQIHVLDLRSGRERILRGGGHDYLMGWNAGSASLLVVDHSLIPQLQLQPLREGREAGRRQRLPGEYWRTSSLRSSGHGRFFYLVQAGSSSLHTLFVDSEGAVRPQPLLTRSPARFFDLSADGYSITYSYRYPSAGAESFSGVAVHSGTGAERALALPWLKFADETRWTSAGIEFRAADLDNRWGIYRLEHGTGRVTQLAESMHRLADWGWT
jgi:hypothetical protein